MPPRKPLKTYEKKTRTQNSNISKSVEAINALFVQNLTKRFKCRRKKAKLKLKELPPRTQAYITDDSIKVDPDNTFDKLLKGNIYNKVQLGNFAKVNSSDSDASKVKLQTSENFQSPVLTRRRRRQLEQMKCVISDSSSSSKQVSASLEKNSKGTSASLGKSSTLDKPVTSSLYVEKEKSKVLSLQSLSYIKLPKITENEVMSANPEKSYDPIFTDTFRERQAVHSSTPCVTLPTKKIVADSISPITKSDSSNSSKLIEISYDQIRKWDENFPNLDAGETPVRRSPRARADNKVCRRKLSTVNNDDLRTSSQDWKLHCQPKVYLQPFNWVNRHKTRSKTKADCDGLVFRGFSVSEQSSSSKESSEIQMWLNSMDLHNRMMVRRIWPKLRYDARKCTNHEKKSTIKRSFKHSNGRRSNSTVSFKTETRGRKSKRRIERNSRDSSDESKDFTPPKISKREKDKRSTLSKPSVKNTPIKGTDETKNSSKRPTRTAQKNKTKIRTPPRVSNILRVVEQEEKSPNLPRRSRRFSSRRDTSRSLQTPKTSSGSQNNKDKPVRTPKVSPKNPRFKKDSPKVMLPRLKKSSPKVLLRRLQFKRKTKTPTPPKKSPTVKSRDTRKMLEFVDETGRRLTTRKHVVYSVKSEVVSNSRKSKIKRPVFNITDDILSEKEISYSHSTSLESSFRFSDSEALSKISSPRIIERSSNVITVDLKDFNDFVESHCRQELYESRRSSLKDETNINVKSNQVSISSIISLSDDSVFENPPVTEFGMNQLRSSEIKPERNSLVEKSVPDSQIEEPVSSVVSSSQIEPDSVSQIKEPDSVLPIEEPNSVSQIKEPDSVFPIEEPDSVSQIDELDSASQMDEPLSVSQLEEPVFVSQIEEPVSVSHFEDSMISCNRRLKHLDFVISPNGSNKVSLVSSPSNSKIIILSNITLGHNNKPIDNDALERYRTVYHDHSYSNSPVPQKAKYSSPATVNKKCSVQSTSLAGRIFSELSDIIDSSILVELNGSNIKKKLSNVQPNRNKLHPKKDKQNFIKLKPGKLYRRTLSLLRRTSIVLDVRESGVCQADCVCLKCQFREKMNKDVSRKSIQVPVQRQSLNNTLLESYARNSICYVQKEEFIDNDLDDSIRGLSLISNDSLIDSSSLPIVTAKDVVLRRCGQADVSPFEECYPRSALQNCQKIGEGVYGEVFLYRNQNGGTTVMKVIPIEGDLIVNGERQKKFEEILSEIVIAMELSNLRTNKKNTTSGFAEVQKVRCTQGNYPDRLLDLWELYDETRGSENDSPQMFPSNQLYIVLELANGGQDLESFVFNNAQQVFAMFIQTACALAVAESQLKFEHRDLHWGNILLSPVDKAKTIRFRLDGKEIEIETHGVEVSIIDFTLSRIEFDNVVIFNDLSVDPELFVAKGDYQFDIYRLMQEANGNKWQHFEPYSNILWLHYVLDKAVASALRCKNTRTKIHKEYMGKLKKFKDEILSFHSAVEFVNQKFV